MDQYDADDVAVALNTLFVNVVAPLVMTHPEREAFCEMLAKAYDDAEGHTDPAVSLARTVVGNVLDAIGRET
jgi:hypothetical protein